ncbi:hypothetical protein GE09DRAFT_1182409 [Coniochaeta sp. 2T2.1]|nr:hypothetical protein GE09DRAFT_1182409 [Coniochaeta sp. 2T2.1]
MMSIFCLRCSPDILPSTKSSLPITMWPFIFSLISFGTLGPIGGLLTTCTLSALGFGTAGPLAGMPLSSSYHPIPIRTYGSCGAYKASGNAPAAAGAIESLDAFPKWICLLAQLRCSCDITSNTMMGVGRTTIFKAAIDFIF